MKSNALKNETSPYLLQHAQNPVYWYPWSAESLDLARKEQKPILLSIGYSACHWCHVMAHESFENSETADVMNKYFINIKVDREERPDLDRIYQTAHQLLTHRSGGWPLTMILTHDDQVPFFGGTYFPPEPRFGLPGFKELLERIADMYNTQLPAIRKQNNAMIEALEKTQTIERTQGNITTEPISQAVKDLDAYFDHKSGGHTGAPKFPQSPTQEFLLSLSHFTDPKIAKMATDMVSLTLANMAKGGIYDHLGGGFCRYSVDQHWLIPHFEKMLYDNGQLLANYAHLYQITNDPMLLPILSESADWIIRDMQSPAGGYYSSLDADSEGEEGKFYVWTHEEIKQVLEDSEYERFAEYYGMNNPPNFEGKWHLYVPVKNENDNISQSLQSAKSRLLEIRNGRVWPGRDEKILTSWNALTIKGMALTYLITEDKKYLQSAVKALEFVLSEMLNEDRLFATYKDGKAHLNAYLDDYVFLVDAILTLLTATWETRWLNVADKLCAILIEKFYDTETGGFYFTSHDHESLIQRRKDFMDDATPSGNGIAVKVLLRMGHLTGRQEYLDAADATLKAAWNSIESYPLSHATLLHALRDYAQPPRQIIIRGRPDDLVNWHSRCFAATRDINTEIYAIAAETTDLPELLGEKRPDPDSPIAYLCEGFQCKTPFTNLEQLISDLKHCAIE